MLKKLLTESGLYGVSHVMSRLISYLLVILHTAIFDASSYGIITLIYSWIALLNIGYTFGLETTYFRFATQKNAHANQVFSSLYRLLLAIGFVLTFLLIIFSDKLSAFFNYPQVQTYIILAALILLVDSLSALPFARLRLDRKVKRFVGLKLLNVILNVALNLYFLWYCPHMQATNLDWSVWFYDPKWGIAYVFLANLSANLVIFLCLIPQVYLSSSRFSFQSLKKYLLYSSPLVLSGIAFVINELADRVLLEKWLPQDYYQNLTSLDAVGVYSACYKLSIFITISIQAFKYAAEPFFFKHASNKRSPQYFAIIMTYFVLFCAFVFSLVSINLDWISSVFLRQEIYRQGLDVVPILLLANIFLGIYYNLSIWFKYTNKTYWAALMGLIGIFITLAVNYWTIPIWGYMGSALATLLCYLGISILSYTLGQRYYPVPYRLKTIFIYLFTAVVFVYLSNHFWPLYLKNFIFLIILIVVIYNFKNQRLKIKKKEL